MSNVSGNAYALTTFCPIINGYKDGMSNCSLIRKKLQELPENEDSPLAKVANTYLARFYILDDAIFQSYPNTLDKLQSHYLVFTANLHGNLDAYLTRMWNSISDDIKQIWAGCVGFDKVDSAPSFVNYIKKCRVTTTFFFNGSTDDSLEEQLKSLFLKQEFSKFVFAHQGTPAKQLLQDFKEFINYSQPKVLGAPTWKAGACSLDGVCEKIDKAYKDKEPILHHFL
jgi:hypothetical protein